MELYRIKTEGMELANENGPARVFVYVVANGMKKAYDVAIKHLQKIYRGTFWFVGIDVIAIEKHEESADGILEKLIVDSK